MDTEKINVAVQSILAACFTADDAMECLRAELERLRTTREWSEIELCWIQQLTLSTAKALTGR